MERKHALPIGGFARALLLTCLLTGLFGIPSPTRAAPTLPALGTTPAISAAGGVAGGAVAWGDYDNDGDLDLLAAGMNPEGSSSTILYTNTGSSLVKNTAVNFQQVQSSSVAWGDYDNDGYLDVLLTGLVRVENGKNVAFSGVYHNVASGSGRGFTLLPLNLPAVFESAGAWGDINNDGRLDFMIAGTDANGAPLAKLYRNTGAGSFTAAATVLTPLSSASAAWGDFDNDGYTDLVYTGRDASGKPTILIYRNDRSGGLNSPVSPVSLDNPDKPDGLYSGTVNFIDYNKDGYLDLLLTGRTSTSSIVTATRLYQYISTGAPYFREVGGTGLPGVWNSSVSVGDYNNDGLPDIALNGQTASQRLTRVYTNAGSAAAGYGAFADAGAALPNEAGLSLAWGDFDSDGSLDLALTGVPSGAPGSEVFTTNLYHNTPPTANTPPSRPTLNSACWNMVDRLILNWYPASDSATSAAALQYSLRIGTTPGGSEIMSPQADPVTGLRRTAEMGNVFGGTSAVLSNLPAGDYYWTVQSVDSAYLGGPFTSNTGVINLGQQVAMDDHFPDISDNQADVILPVLDNDAKNGETLSIGGFSLPNHGKLTKVNNQFVYTPNSPYEGTDSFYYYALRDTTRYCTRGLVTIDVHQHNDPPTAINLSNTEVPDGAPANTQVGQFTTADPDVPDSFTYALVPSGGDNLDNASFSITGDMLSIKVSPKYSVKPSYAIHVRSTDAAGESVEATFTITVTGNHAPTDIFLSKNSVLENQKKGTVVGAFTAEDADPGETFTYALATKNGSAFDNASFTISNDKLITNEVFTYNKKNIYTIYVRATDRGGLSVGKSFTINITRTPPTVSWYNASGVWSPSPALVTMSEDGLTALGQADEFALSLQAIDAGASEELTWSISTPPLHGQASVSGTTVSKQVKTVQYTPNPNWNSGSSAVPDTFKVKVTDPGGSSAEITVQVNVLPVNDPPRFDFVASPIFRENSGAQTITVRGISAGAANETEQVGFYVMVYGTTTPTLTNIKVSPSMVRSGGIVNISMTVGTGTGKYTLRLIANDGSAFSSVTSQVFTVTVRSPSDFTDRFYMPLIQLK